MAIVLGEVESESSSRVYRILLGKDDRVYCECPRWKFKKTCKHLDQWREAMEQQELEDA